MFIVADVICFGKTIIIFFTMLNVAENVIFFIRTFRCYGHSNLRLRLRQVNLQNKIRQKEIKTKKKAA
jgi:hypothetical protein